MRFHASPAKVTLSAGTASSHPNKMRIKGVLVRLDEPSTKAPNGARGHRILVPTEVAKRSLGTLVGMGLNYAEDLKGHAQRRKVGVITKAWIDGKDLRVEADVWKHDFPEAQRDLRQDKLGMSMEIGEVSVEDEDASIWTISDMCFLGATILKRDSAAYYKTLAIAASKSLVEGRSVMKKKETEAPVSAGTLSAEQIAEIAAVAAASAVKPIVSTIKAQGVALSEIAAQVAELSVDIAAARKPDSEIDAEDEVDEKIVTKEGKDAVVAQFGDEDEEDEDEEDDEMESAVDKGSLDDMGTKTKDSVGDEPGELNKGAKNKGSQTTAEDQVGNTVSSSAAVRVLTRKLKEVTAQLQASTATIARLQKRMKKIDSQVVKASAEMSRRSVAIPADLRGLFSKQNMDPVEMQASGQKLTISDLDAMLKDSNLDVTQRMQIKNSAFRCGLLEEGGRY